MHTCRPKLALTAVGKRYLTAWKRADEFRADRPQPWPEWCYLPLAGWYAIACEAAKLRNLSSRPDLMADVAKLGALGTWRVTQGIYRFDPTLYAALADTAIGGDLPTEILYRLPEWCVYLETPGLQWAGTPLHGVWAHLEYDTRAGRTELRLLTDSDAVLLPIVLHLGTWSLAESIERAIAQAMRNAQAVGLGQLPSALTGIDHGGLLRPLLAPVLSMLLYLCSQHAEIGDGQHSPANPLPKRTKAGLRLFAPDQPTTWDVGVRMGSALRQYHGQQTDAGGAMTHNNRQLAFHRFDRQPGDADYWRDKLDEIEWPT